MENCEAHPGGGSFRWHGWSFVLLYSLRTTVSLVSGEARGCVPGFPTLVVAAADAARGWPLVRPEERPLSDVLREPDQDLCSTNTHASRSSAAL